MGNFLKFYLLADGTQGSPDDCERDADGVLRHIYGMPVALHEDGEPMTVGDGAAENKNVEAAQAGELAAAAAAQQGVENASAAKAEATVTEAPVTQVEPATEKPSEPEAAPTAEVRDIKPAPARKYKTREVKGR